jgi:hypothetical protein
MMKAASTYETSVNFYQTTWRNNSEDSHLHTRRCENLKSHLVNLYGGGGGIYCTLHSDTRPDDEGSKQAPLKRR